MTEPRYILLAEGEKIQEGDEFYCHSPEGWHKCSPPHYVVSVTHGPIRRKVEGWREIKDERDMSFPCACGYWETRYVTVVRSCSDIPGGATHWLPLPPLPVKQSEADIAWAEYCKERHWPDSDNFGQKAIFVIGFESGRKK